MFDFEDRWLDKSLKKSTVYEEIKRGKYNGRYTAGIAQNRAEKRRRESHKHSKWKNSKLLNFIERHLKMMWSPVSHELSENGVKFSHTNIYTVIKKHRPEWRKSLVHRGKKVRHKVHFLSKAFDLKELAYKVKEVLV